MRVALSTPDPVLRALVEEHCQRRGHAVVRDGAALAVVDLRPPAAPLVALPCATVAVVDPQCDALTARRALDGGARYLLPFPAPAALVFAHLEAAETIATAGQPQTLLGARILAEGRLAAGMAHEINNPLTYLLVNVGLLQEELQATQAGERSLDVALALQLVRECQGGAERVRGLVQDLRMLASRDDEVSEPVDLVAIAHSACNVMESEVQKRARLVRELHPVPRVPGNPARIGQVILHLVRNAVEAIPRGKSDEHRVVVRVMPGDAGAVVLEVEDTGEGVPPELRDRIFEPFFTTKPVGVGRGLGLALCHGIVGDLGGEIAVHRAAEGPTVFRVSLPALRDSQPPSELGRAAPGLRLLVVDDDPTVAASISRLLRSLGSIHVEHDARRALARLDAGERFDVILCDLLMPEMPGMALQRVLEERHPHLAERTVFMTGGAFTAEAQAFLDTLPGRALEKPFSLDDVRAHLARRSLSPRG